MRTIRPVPLWPALWRFAVVLPIVLGGSEATGQGQLGNVRTDVRTPPPPDSSPPAPRRPSPDEDDRRDRRGFYNDDDDNWFGMLCLGGLAAGVTSPVWAPRLLVGDFGTVGHFPRFPYDDTLGAMVGPDWDYSAHRGARQDRTLEERCALACGEQIEPGPTQAYMGRERRWAARLRGDYADTFDDLSRIGGHLLLSTTSRFGLDTEMSYWEEKSGGTRFDELWAGDCNLVYRFAQSPHMQWRIGLGFNWLDDPIQTDFGFNFTYGIDWFPRKPWVVSAELDLGTLGHAHLFHFRTTVGAIIRHVEVYSGYENQIIGRTSVNSLVAGVRLWF